MTHDESERVAVTQADREAAAHLHDCIFGHENAEAAEGYKCLLSGERDDEFMVQTIASHRVEHGRSKEAAKWRESLDWAIAEIEGRTRYDKPEQFERCLRLANEALSTRPTPADPAVEREDDEIISEFAFLWRNYALADDGSLAPDALALKGKLLAALSTRPTPAGPAVERLRPEVLAFAHLMEQRLRANDHKPGWKDDEPTALVTRAEEELDELRCAVDGWMDHTGYTEVVHRKRVAREAADVANFAMMIADVCAALSTTQQPPAEVSLRNVVSHATGGCVTDVEGQSLNDICVAISRHHNRIWEGGIEKGRKEAQPAHPEPARVSREAVEKAAQYVLDNSRRSNASLSDEQRAADTEALMAAYRDIITKAVARSQGETGR